MALITCKECKAQVSNQAKTCPQCGAKVPKKTSVLTWIFGFVILGVVFASINKGESMKANAIAKQEAKPVAWIYRSQNDPMTSKPTRTASLASTNSLALASPYSGENFGGLEVRQKAGKADEILFSLEKGQTFCKSYAADCKVLVRFDDAQPITFAGQNPSDGSSNFVFISPASKFISEAKKAKQIKVSIDVYQNGVQILNFGTATALNW